MVAPHLMLPDQALASALAPLGVGPGLIAGALLAEAVMGYPSPVFNAVRHPVVWIGALIARLDRALNREAWSPRARRVAGAVTAAALVLAAALPAAAVQALVLRALPPWLAWPVLFAVHFFSLRRLAWMLPVRALSAAHVLGCWLLIGVLALELRYGLLLLSEQYNAWRWLGWRMIDPSTGQLRILPAETFGPLPA